MTSRPFEAQFDGKCAACGESISEGDMIVRCNDGAYAHEGDCAEEWEG